jgi:ubiquinone/menaquinone biosynthesis C-methylase UbiE
VVAREADLPGRSVLEVGCGTGTFAVALAERARCRVSAIDAEPEMLEVARARAPDGLEFQLGTAEALPFPADSQERVVMRLLVHLIDRPRAFREARRVLGSGGVLAIATFDPGSFEESWLNRFFPSIAAIDGERFPPPARLGNELARSGFDVKLVRLEQTATFTRDQVLEKIRGKHIGTFDLIPDREYEEGLGRAVGELPERVVAIMRWVVAIATVD